jgi:hypothetical protein
LRFATRDRGGNEVPRGGRIEEPPAPRVGIRGHRRQISAAHYARSPVSCVSASRFAALAVPVPPLAQFEPARRFEPFVAWACARAAS